MDWFVCLCVCRYAGCKIGLFAGTGFCIVLKYKYA